MSELPGRDGGSLAAWRRWAILLALSERPRRAKDLYWWTKEHDWAVLSPHGQMDQIHRTCSALCQGHPALVLRHTGRLAMFELTETGRNWVRESLVDNPQITAEASRARFSPDW